MKRYIGTEIILAEPAMDSEGRDGFKIFHKCGYESWLPRDLFKATYTVRDHWLDFGTAIGLLYAGYKLTRKGWNGEGQWIVLMPALDLPPHNSQEPGAKVNDRTAKHIGPNTPLHSLPYIAMWTAKSKWQPGWVPSQADMMTCDWDVFYN